MAIVEVTSREFREKQKTYLDMADKGIQVILKRGSKQAYALTPITNDDLYITPELKERLDKSILQAKEGNTIRISSHEELDKFLNSL